MKKVTPKVEKRKRAESAIVVSSSESSGSDDESLKFLSSEVQQALMLQEEEERNSLSQSSEDLDSFDHAPTPKDDSFTLVKNSTETSPVTKNNTNHKKEKNLATKTATIEPQNTVEDKTKNNNNNNNNKQQTKHNNKNKNISTKNGHKMPNSRYYINVNSEEMDITNSVATKILHVTHTLRPHIQYISLLYSFTKVTKQYICSASNDGSVAISEFINKKLSVVVKFLAHKENLITSFSWSHDHEYLLTCSLDHTVKLWQPYARKKINTYYLGVRLLSVAFNPLNTNQFLVGDIEGNLHLYNVSNSKAQILRKENCSITALSMTNDGDLFVGCSNGNVVIWKYVPTKGQFIYQTSKSLYKKEINIFYCYERLHLALVKTKDKMHLASIPDFQIIHTFTHPQSSVYLCGAFASNGRVIVAGAEDGSLSFYSLTGTLLKHMTNAEAITAVAFSNDGFNLVTSSSTGKLSLWMVVGQNFSM
eukprot:TRINITY_DN8248_c0_g1_i1.p1 TRINITY_DN8248_c0_g1~~TRINITY_DN8248_c0_g1_i1.p1  ORF type:complete len:477 (-),score=68.46 TRINITY_DN8248_c0_g1_i1:27-1457(-)